MSRKKASPAATKQPTKKINKRAPKAQTASVALDLPQEAAVDTLHETLVVHHERPTPEKHDALSHVEKQTHTEDVTPAHEVHDELPPVSVSHHNEHAVEDERKSGVLAAIAAFKQSNEVQFYGIVAIAVFVLLLIL